MRIPPTFLKSLAFTCYALEALLALHFLYSLMKSVLTWHWSHEHRLLAEFGILFLFFIVCGALGILADEN